MAGVRCGWDGITAKGEPCRAWAVRGSDPPRCVAHGGGEGRVGAPPGSKNALKHGAYAEPDEQLIDLAGVIDDCKRRFTRLGTYIDEHVADLEAVEFAKLLELHGRLASRIGRLERDLQKLGGSETSDFMQVIGEALDRLSKEWGIKL